MNKFFIPFFLLITLSNQDTNSVNRQKIELKNDTIKYIKLNKTEDSTIIFKRAIFKKDTFDIIFVSKGKKIGMILKDSIGKPLKSFENLLNSKLISSQKVELLMNGGMYTEENLPQGLYIEKGNIIKKIDTNKVGYGNFYLQPNGIFIVSDKGNKVISTDSFIAFRLKCKYATQSGPMLVNSNKINKLFVKDSKNYNIRNGVGIDNKGNTIFVISNNKVNFYNFASIFRDKLNCKNALYLDGAISKIYCPKLKKFETKGSFGPIIYVYK